MRLFGLKKHRTLAVAADAMNLSLIAGGDEKIAFSVECQRPDIFLMGIVENLGLAVGPDLVDLAVRIGGGIDLIAEIDGDGMDFQSFELGEGAALPARIDREQLRRSAAGTAARRISVAPGVR